MRRFAILSSVIRWLKSSALVQIGSISVFLLSGYDVASATQASVTGTITSLAWISVRRENVRFLSGR